ncbi:hypothetical protein MMC17_005592 [Xylographa soralifera]|nr:hypothetical protein [Xylographa soralifera]
MTSFRDDYVLGRGFQATTSQKNRLNLQHYIWKDTTGYLVHPSISLDKQDLKVADVGTGTGIWLLDLARILPYSARLNGYDITLAQCPVKEWLPPNVTFSTLDAFAEIPEHLIGQYDVVHVKLIILVVKDNDPTILLQNLMKMLSKFHSVLQIRERLHNPRVLNHMTGLWYDFNRAGRLSPMGRV